MPDWYMYAVHLHSTYGQFEVGNMSVFVSIIQLDR